MPGSTVFSSMTDEQLALWHQQDTKIQQLTRDLTEARTAVEALRATADLERANLKAQLQRSCDEVIRLTQANASERVATRRLCAEQVQLVRALRALLNLLCSEKYAGVQRQFGGEVFRAIQEADEVCRLCEVPFG